MGINPFDPRASSPEQIAEQFGNLIKTELYEIGYAYIGTRKINCDENRKIAQKRFIIRDNKNSYAVRLWNGTSEWVDCEEVSNQGGEDDPTYEIDGKDTNLGMSIHQLNDKLDIIYNIADNLGLFNLTNGLYHRELDNIDDLLTELHKIKVAISQNK